MIDPKKIEEIAHILKKKPGTVKSLLSRGLSKLKQKLEVQPKLTSRIIDTQVENMKKF